MPKKKVEVYDKDKLIYPFIENDHVTFSNGMKVSEMLDQSISMPTITHNETSFKVGVGDSDVSSSIVDSSVSKMVIKGQTYQNILPEPSLRNKMIGKSMQRLNEGYDNIEVVDGVSKSAILTGQTLVNLNTNTNVSQNLSVGVTRFYRLKIPYTIVANKPFTLKLNVKDSTVTQQVMMKTTHIDDTLTYDVIKEGNSTGYVNKLFTKTKDVKDIGIYVQASETGNATIENVVLLEGDHTQEDIPYFEGMQSVKMPVLQTVGKNLFDKVSLGLGGNTYTNTVEYLPQLNNNTRATLSKGKLITVEPNSTVTLSCDNRFKCVIQEYDENENRTKSGDKGWQNGGSHTLTVGEKTNKINIYFAKQDPHSSEGITDEELSLLKDSVQVEISSSKTTYEPHKTNILTVNEPVELRGIGNVKDELDLATGELTQRIGEIVFDGSETSWGTSGIQNQTETMVFQINSNSIRTIPHPRGGSLPICDKLPSNNTSTNDTEGILVCQGTDGHGFYIRIKHSKLSTQDVNGLKTYLQSNPITIKYVLETPIIKTVDLSSHGNWEKVVLDGSENWSVAPDTSNNNAFFRGGNTVPNNVKVNSNNVAQKVICDILTPFTQPQLCNKPNDNYGISLGWNNSDLCVRPKDFPLTNEGLTQWKQYLSQNPITIWYQTTTTQDNSIREMLSFANGHLQVSSEAENSLLPSVQYEIPTKNSYHMDLMKTNTLYTMKAKTVSGTFTIDGTSYNVNANGTFTTPSSMTNKLLVMSNKTNTEVMILEGDVTSKTIPYFRGIKSAFEDESKIEVLSTGKNLFDGAFEKGVIYANGNLGYTTTAIRTVNYISVKPNTSYHINLLNLESFESLRVIYVHEYDENLKVLGETQVGNRNTYTSKNATKFIKINTHTAHDLPVDSKMIIYENSTLDKQYEPHKSNNTKIPLLSPLRSLPNGICDELIIDRLNHKAKLIQRVGKAVFDGSSDEVMWFNTGWTNGDCVACYWDVSRMSLPNKKFGTTNMVCDKFPTVRASIVANGGVVTGEGIWGEDGSSVMYISLNKTKLTELSVNGFRQWASQNPFTVLYELKTPIITEIDLEGFPYIYKDGHIFLNSEIAPTTQITYNINQSHQIESANENLQRHEKEISHLQKLIAQYIQVEYESTLLSLKI